MLAEWIGAPVRSLVAEQQDVAGAALDAQPGADEPRFAALIIVVEIDQRRLQPTVGYRAHEVEMGPVFLSW